METLQSTEAALLLIILQLSAIIAVARLAGVASSRLGQPVVVGEILAGILLGPSVLGRVAPGLSASLFPPSTTQTIQMISQIGLIFLMFLIGLEFDFGHIRTHGRAAALVAVSGIACPFALGAALGAWMAPGFPGVNATGFTLFLATALSITAIPVLGRVMVEFNLQRTELGVLTITAAAIDDALGWTLLALVAAFVGARLDLLDGLRMAGFTLAFTAGMVLVVRPLLLRGIRWTLARGDLSPNALAATLVLLFLSAAATSLIGIFSLFGALVLGAVLHDQEEFRQAVFRRLKDFVAVFFLPIFFTHTGLQTDLGTLESPGMLGMLAAVVAAGFAGKFLGCAAAARLSGLSARRAAAVGVMMNARGLMGLIAASAGVHMGVLPRPAYTMLVALCVVSTLALAPALRRLLDDAPQSR